MNFIEKQIKKDALQFDQEAIANIAKVNSKITSNLAQASKPRSNRFSLSNPFLLIGGATAAIAIMITLNLDNRIQTIPQQQELTIKLETVENYSTMLVSSTLNQVLIDNLQKEKQALSKDIDSLKKLFVL